MMNALRTVRKSDLPAIKKTELTRGYIKLKTLSRMCKRQRGIRTTNIAGLKLSGFSYYDLYYLYKEIFLGLSYKISLEKSNPKILDCGSNIGMSMLFFKYLYPGAHIIGFEPDTDSYNLARLNIQQNQLDDIEIHNIALSKQSGEIDFYFDPDRKGSLAMSTIEDRMAKASRTISCEKLSNYIQSNIDLIKMDIEGAELDVIEELDEAGKMHLVDNLLLEYHHHIRQEDMLAKLFTILEDNGFSYQIYTDNKLPLIKDQFQDILIFAYRR